MQNIITIKNESDILRASLYLKKLINDLNKDIIDSAELALSELLTNTMRYANNAQIHIERDDNELLLKTTNSGSMKLPDFMDGITSGKSLGIGLGVIGRSSDEIIYRLSPVEITWIKYLKPVGSKFNMAYKTEPLVFGANGDKIIIQDMPSYLFVSVVDAAGHGSAASKLANKISKHISTHYFLKLDDLMISLCYHLKDSTRRAVVEFIKIWKNKDKFEFCGVGDVSCKIFGAYHETFKLNRGIIGGHYDSRNLSFKVEEKNISKKSVIAMFSDGISNRFNIEAKDIYKDPKIYIDTLFDKYKRDDDKSLVLIKC